MGNIMNKFCFGSSALLLACCVYTASASDDFYLRADLGISQSNSVSTEEMFYKKSGEKKFKKGFAYSFGVGYKFNENFRTELAYNGVSNLKYSTTKDDSKYKQKLKLHALMANLNYDLPSKYNFRPYIGVGLGYSKINPGIASYYKNNLTLNKKAKNSNNFTYALMTDIAYNVNEKVALDVGYRFQDFGKAKNLSSGQLPGMQYVVLKEVKSRFKIKTHSIMAGVRYSF